MIQSQLQLCRAVLLFLNLQLFLSPERPGLAKTLFHESKLLCTSRLGYSIRSLCFHNTRRIRPNMVRAQFLHSCECLGEAIWLLLPIQVPNSLYRHCPFLKSLLERWWMMVGFQASTIDAAFVMKQPAQ